MNIKILVDGNNDAYLLVESESVIPRDGKITDEPKVKVRQKRGQSWNQAQVGVDGKSHNISGYVKLGKITYGEAMPEEAMDVDDEKPRRRNPQ
jgi:hypothetical protein